MSAAHHESVRVLYADDEPDFADLPAMHLECEREAFDVCTVTSATEGLDRLALAFEMHRRQVGEVRLVIGVEHANRLAVSCAH